MYGGLCGKVKSLNNHKYAEKWSEQSSDWVKAEFLSPFPLEIIIDTDKVLVKIKAYLTKVKAIKYISEKREFGGWFYIDDYGNLIAFNHASRAIMLGSDEPTPTPKWEIYVLNPTYI